MSRPDVLIVGGGIIGAAVARALAHREVSVHVIEGSLEPGAATQAAGGMLAPLAEAEPEDPLLRLTVRARDLYTSLAPVLTDETGIDIGLWSDGILQVAFTDDAVSAAKSAVAWQRQRGFSADWLSPDELRERVPGIGPEALGAILASEDGALEPLALHEALLASASARGTEIVRDTTVDEILIEESRVTGVRTGSEVRTAGAVVVAAGCWSGRLRGLPRPVSIEPIRGQMVALPWPEGEPRAIVYGGHGYVLNRGAEAVAGSTMEHAGFDPSVTDEGLETIGYAMRRLYPALDRSKVVRTWAGLRPSTPDGRPLLGRDPGVENLWYATGHGRNGILLAALTGEFLADLYLGEPIEHDLSPMDPGRFWTS